MSIIRDAEGKRIGNISQPNGRFWVSWMMSAPDLKGRAGQVDKTFDTLEQAEAYVHQVAPGATIDAK